MKYLAGIDGGGTKTHCCITDSEANLIDQFFGSASNFQIIGIDNAVKNITGLIENSCKKTAINYDDLAAVLIGTAGAGRRPDAEKLERALIDYFNLKEISFNKFFVESDARIALEGAFSGRPGLILISGTGSIIFGKDSNENIYRAGGFGRFIGDEGSGYSIGRNALISAAKEFDGRDSETLITKILSEKFNIKSAEILIREVYQNNFDIASAATAVLEAAEQNDAAALKIIDKESDELLLHISAMIKKIDKPDLEISLMGGLLKEKNFFSKKLIEKIIENFPELKIKEPEMSPAMGAIILAKKYLEKG